MNACFEYELLISQKLDDELSESDEILLADHLRSCSSCRALYDELAQIQRTLASCSAAPPADLSARVLEQIKAEEPSTEIQASSPTPRRMKLKWFATTAAALLVVISSAVLGIRMLPSTDNASLANDAPTTNEKVSKEASDSSLAQLAELPEEQIEEGALASPQSENPVPSIQKRTASPSTQTVIADPPPVLTEAYGTETEPIIPPPDEATEERSSDTRTLFGTFSANDADAPPENISSDQAEALLIDYLTSEEDPYPAIVLQEESADDTHYFFHYADLSGYVWCYSISKSDGSIHSESSTQSQTSAHD